jgi:hypothetical protein
VILGGHFLSSRLSTAEKRSVLLREIQERVHRKGGTQIEQVLAEGVNSSRGRTPCKSGEAWNSQPCTARQGLVWRNEVWWAEGRAGWGGSSFCSVTHGLCPFWGGQKGAIERSFFVCFNLGFINSPRGIVVKIPSTSTVCFDKYTPSILFL